MKQRHLTLMSVVSAFAVVFLHTNACFWTYSTEGYWFSANIIESVFYFAVPVFFMISGATLVDYRERYSTKEFFIRRLKKTFIPFIAWSFIGLACKVLLSEIPLTDLSVKYVINGILGTSIMDVYWFFPPLFCVYLCMPLLSAVPESRRKSVFTYLSVLCFVTGSLVPFLKNIFSLDLVWPFSVTIGSGYLLYVMIGYLLNTYGVSKPVRTVLYIAMAAGLAAHIIGTYCLSVRAGDIVKTYKGYTNVPCVMYSVGIFVLFKYNGDRLLNGPVGKFVDFMGEYTFGLYLCHYFILKALEYLFSHLLSVPVQSLVYRLSAPFFIVAIAVVLISVARKIPVIRNIVP